jgi:hypothetical protein
MVLSRIFNQPEINPTGAQSLKLKRQQHVESYTALTVLQDTPLF